MRFCMWPCKLVATEGTGGLASLSAAGPCRDSCRRPEGGTADTALERSHQLPAREGKWGKYCSNKGTVNRVTWKGSKGLRELKASSVNGQGSSLDVNGVRVQGTFWCLIFHLQDFDLINCRIGLCKRSKLAVLLQTPKVNELGRRFTK